MDKKKPGKQCYMLRTQEEGYIAFLIFQQSQKSHLFQYAIRFCLFGFTNL